jgi:hypothetical protein
MAGTTIGWAGHAVLFLKPTLTSGFEVRAVATDAEGIARRQTPRDPACR